MERRDAAGSSHTDADETVAHTPVSATAKLIGYARVSKSDGSQSLDPQIDALVAAGVARDDIYHDRASGAKSERPGLAHCLRACRAGDTLVVWKLDRLGRTLTHLIATVDGLSARQINFKVLAGQGGNIDTGSPSGRLVFSLFAALAEFERGLISERTRAGLASARARGRTGGRRHSLSARQVRLVLAGMRDKDTRPSELAKEFGVSRSTLYRYVSPDGELRSAGEKILNTPSS